jgi:hypothetical protein
MTDDTSESKLEALRARRVALAEAAAARNAPSVDEQIAEETNKLEAAEAYDRAQVEHGAKQVALIETAAGDVVLRRPHVAAYRKFQDAEGNKSESAIEFVKSCLLYPPKPTFDKWYTEQAGILPDLANACVVLAGFRDKNAKGK